MIKEKRFTRNDFRERADFQSEETVNEVIIKNFNFCKADQLVCDVCFLNSISNPF